MLGLTHGVAETRNVLDAFNPVVVEKLRIFDLYCVLEHVKILRDYKNVYLKCASDDSIMQNRSSRKWILVRHPLYGVSFISHSCDSNANRTSHRWLK